MCIIGKYLVAKLQLKFKLIIIFHFEGTWLELLSKMVYFWGEILANCVSVWLTRLAPLDRNEFMLIWEEKL